MNAKTINDLNNALRKAFTMPMELGKLLRKIFQERDKEKVFTMAMELVGKWKGGKKRDYHLHHAYGARQCVENKYEKKEIRKKFNLFRENKMVKKTD